MIWNEHPRRGAAPFKRLLMQAMMLAMLGLMGATGSVAHGKRVTGVALHPLSQLTTHTGGTFDVAQLRGRPFVVTFGYTSCADVCPTTLLELSNDLAALGEDGRRVTVLFVTVDPDFDTVGRLADYLGAFDPRIIGLTGSTLGVEEVAHGFNATYERVPGEQGRYTVDHTTRSYFFDRYGLLAGRHDILKEPGRKRIEMLRKLLAQ